MNFTNLIKPLLLSLATLLISCVAVWAQDVSGCTIATAVNYNPSATILDDTCLFPFSDIDFCTPEFTPVTVCFDQVNAQNPFSITEIDLIFDPSISNITGLCFTYTPLPAFQGEEVIDVTICDASLNCEEATVNLVVGSPFTCVGWQCPDSFYDSNICQCLDLEDPPIEGCTDPTASNYDPSATCDNNTCMFENVTTGIADRSEKVISVSYSSSGSLLLRLPEGSVSTPYSIFSIEGRFILSGVVDSITKSLDLSDVNPGIYLIRTSFGTKRFVL